MNELKRCSKYCKINNDIRETFNGRMLTYKDFENADLTAFQVKNITYTLTQTSVTLKITDVEIDKLLFPLLNKYPNYVDDIKPKLKKIAKVGPIKEYLLNRLRDSLLEGKTDIAGQLKGFLPSSLYKLYQVLNGETKERVEDDMKSVIYNIKNESYYNTNCSNCNKRLYFKDMLEGKCECGTEYNYKFIDSKSIRSLARSYNDFMVQYQTIINTITAQINSLSSQDKISCCFSIYGDKDINYDAAIASMQIPYDTIYRVVSILDKEDNNV